MGKARHPKKSRVHLKPQSSKPKEDASDSQTVASAGLPMEILSDAPVLKLSSDNTENEHVTMKKKDRKALRHQKWLTIVFIFRFIPRGPYGTVSSVITREMQTIVQEKTLASLSEKRKQTPVVGDMHALIATLPDVQESVASEPKSTKRTQHTTLLSELDHFQKVLTHPSYQSDPLGAIAQHIHNAVTLGKV
ncbi:hypothetical protein EMCRGX_G031670 [Ephydatia muelleri]